MLEEKQLVKKDFQTYSGFPTEKPVCLDKM